MPWATSDPAARGVRRVSWIRRRGGAGAIPAAAANSAAAKIPTAASILALAAVLLLIVPAPPSPCFGTGPPDPIAILRQADHARGNVKGVTWQIELESREKDRVSRLSVAVKSRGYDFVAEELAPPKYRGQRLLMVSGNMWFTKPGLSKPISISRRQRLMGEAAHGDIAATDYADEYEAAIVAEEPVDGEACYVFDLQAKEKKPTYDRIRYWVSKERQVGVRAEYFTVSGKRIKSAVMEYARTVMPGGKTRPFISKIVITDALVSTNVTTLAFRDPHFGDLPDDVFNVNLFGR